MVLLATVSADSFPAHSWARASRGRAVRGFRPAARRRVDRFGRSTAPRGGGFLRFPGRRETSVCRAGNLCPSVCRASLHRLASRAGHRRSETPGRASRHNDRGAASCASRRTGHDASQPQADAHHRARFCGGESAPVRSMPSSANSAFRSSSCPPTRLLRPGGRASSPQQRAATAGGCMSRGENLEGLRQQGIAGQNRRRFAELGMAAGPAAAQVVVVHRRQVVVDQRIGVNHFHGAGRRQRPLRIATASLGSH